MSKSGTIASRPVLQAATVAVRGAGFDWPINEILLEGLEMRGLSDLEIAERYQVTWRQVAALRKTMR